MSLCVGCVGKDCHYVLDVQVKTVSLCVGCVGKDCVTICCMCR